MNDVFLTQVISESVLCAWRHLTQRSKKITLVVQSNIVKVVEKMFAVNMHCVFVSIVITTQINFIETLDLADLPIKILQWFILLLRIFLFIYKF